jgi:hypothetical protein
MQVMTTLVPPDVEPEVGLMLETVGMVILLVTSAQIKFPVAIHFHDWTASLGADSIDRCKFPLHGHISVRATRDAYSNIILGLTGQKHMANRSVNTYHDREQGEAVSVHGPGRDKRTAKGRGPINRRKLGFAVEWPEDKADTEPK